MLALAPNPPLPYTPHQIWGNSMPSLAVERGRVLSRNLIVKWRAAITAQRAEAVQQSLQSKSLTIEQWLNRCRVEARIKMLEVLKLSSPLTGSCQHKLSSLRVNNPACSWPGRGDAASISGITGHHPISCTMSKSHTHS